MSGNILGSFSNFDRSSAEHLKVMAIESDKKQSLDIPYKGKLIASQKLLRFCLFSLCLQTVYDFLHPFRQNRFLTKGLLEVLSHLQMLFETLSKKDLSQSYQFADDLSLHWHCILHHVKEENLPCREKLKSFVETVNAYPENREHRLGYYLTQFTGEKWLPFPFMEILHHLHEDALANPIQNTLSSWIDALSHLSNETSF